LSGGNQQKVVVAKLLAVGADVLLFHDLTRGIDVGAKAEIFHLMRRLAGEGKAILFYSSENQELVSMCDRVLVLRAGRLAATLSGSELSEERILQAALGVTGEAA
jgi:ribose transport system ATP-binding protein